MIDTHTLLDCLPDTTLLRKDIAQKINLKRKQEKLNATSALSRSQDIDSATASFDISLISVSGSTKISAWVVHNLEIPFNRYDVSEIKKIHPHLKDINFPVLKDSDVTLIGTHHADLLLHRDFRQGHNVGPTAVKITLGWVLMGGNKSVREKGSCNVISNSLTNIDEKIRNFWKLDSYRTLPKMSPELLPPKEKRSLEIQPKNQNHKK